MHPDTFKALEMIRKAHTKSFLQIVILTVVSLAVLAIATVRLYQYYNYLKHDAIVNQEVIASERMHQK